MPCAAELRLSDALRAGLRLNDALRSRAQPVMPCAAGLYAAHRLLPAAQTLLRAPCSTFVFAPCSLLPCSSRGDKTLLASLNPSSRAPHIADLQHTPPSCPQLPKYCCVTPSSVPPAPKSLCRSDTTWRS